MSILITNATVVTVDETYRVIENGAVYVEKDRIAAVGMRTCWVSSIPTLKPWSTATEKS